MCLNSIFCTFRVRAFGGHSKHIPASSPNQHLDIIPRFDVAIGQDGDLHGLFDDGHLIQVRWAIPAVRRRPTVPGMHRDETGTRGGQLLHQLQGVLVGKY